MDGQDETTFTQDLSGPPNGEVGDAVLQCKVALRGQARPGLEFSRPNPRLDVVGDGGVDELGPYGLKSGTSLRSVAPATQAAIKLRESLTAQHARARSRALSRAQSPPSHSPHCLHEPAGGGYVTESVTTVRLLPWLSPEGKPCYAVPDGEGGHLSRLADDIEAVLVDTGMDVLVHARKVLDDPKAPCAEERFAGVRLAECLSDVLRVAGSRGMRLPKSEPRPLGIGGGTGSGSCP